MRWPSFFGRGATAKAAQEPRARAPVREWESLPAIQRTGGGSHLTAPTAAFVNSLAGTHDPDLSLEPLGHHVSLDAPPGLVTGLARSVDTYAPAGELVGRPKPRKEHAVQRREFTSGDGSESSDEGVVDTEPAVERAMLSAPVVEEPAPALTPLTHLAPAEAMAVMHLATPRPVAVEPSAESIVSEGASPE